MFQCHLANYIYLFNRNLIDYPGQISAPTSDLTTMELHVNSAIADVKSRFICMDVKYFYLNYNMDRS